MSSPPFALSRSKGCPSFFRDAEQKGSASTSSARTGDGLTRTILLGWTLAAIVLCLVSATRIATLAFPDPDDAMRLAQVRDLIAGQSWWDVSQHRLNGGDFQMHWSRLVDLPLAAVLIVCDPLFGPATATRIAVTTVPLLTLLAVMSLGAVLTRRVAEIEAAKQSVLLAALSVPLIYQLQPVRIDHHGWQIAAVMGAVVALFGKPDARSGAVAGACLAALVTISLEGLPITAVVTGVALLAWALDPSRRAQALGLTIALPVDVALLHVATRGPAMFAPACDAIAPVWIAGLALACGGAAATILVAPRALAVRIGALGLAGAAALATVRLGAPVCAKGPFATLDPLVYRFWYVNVSEGMPVWDQVPAWAAMTVGLPISGLIGATLAWRGSEGEARARWAMLIGIAGAAFALSVVVMRTGATANALALPGAAWLLHRLLTRARAVPNAGKRTLATAAAFLAATPGLVAGAAFGMRGETAPAPSTQAAGPVPCDPPRDIPRLAALPSAALFAPIDITPAILATTPHRAIAGGYHRNGAAMRRVLAAFLAPPGAAQRLIAASGADYVVGCPGANETQLLARVAPHGLWARLERGERVAWLTPVALPGTHLLVWRVARSKQRLS